MINDEGIPRLSDFGLSQIINDVAGTPFTQSSIVADSFRYFPPEVCTGSGVMSTMADIYALGMTVLEILTHQQPYSKIRMHTQAVVRAANGQRPDRPLEDSVVKRGMNEELWNCLVQCWSLEPEKRPTIEDFIFVLDRVIDATPRR
jgi:serine/threonine protein kinase